MRKLIPAALLVAAFPSLAMPPSMSSTPFTGAPSAPAPSPSPSPSPNNVPSWDIAAQLEMPEDEAYSLTLTDHCTDAEGDSLTFSSTAFPAGLSRTGGSVSGTPTTAGDTSVTFGCDDAGTEVVAESITTTGNFDEVLFTTQNDVFVTTWSVTPVETAINLVMGLSNLSIVPAYSDMRAIVRCLDGTFTAYNGTGGAYSAVNSIPCTQGNTYAVVLTANVAACTFSATVDGTILATNYGFRQTCPTSLASFVTRDLTTVGSTVEDVTIDPPVQAVVNFHVASASDVTPPDAPVAPTLVEAFDTQVDLSFPTSAAVDHSHYDLYRSTDNVDFTLEAAALTSSTYSVDGLADETQYYFALVDEDFSGNESTRGTSLAVTTLVSPLEKPGPTNTGHTTAFASLTPLTGNVTISTPGTTVEGFRRTGSGTGNTITVTAANVTIRDCYIDANGGDYGIFATGAGVTNLVVEDCEITNGDSILVYGRNMTLRRLHLWDSGSDAVRALANSVVEYSYIHSLGRISGPTIPHADAFQMLTGSGNIFRYNNIDMPYNDPTFANSAIFIIQGYSGPVSDVLIEYNWINGADFSVQFNQLTYGVTNARLRNNRFGREYEYGPWAANVGSATDAAGLCGNVWDDTGQLINLDGNTTCAP